MSNRGNFTCPTRPAGDSTNAQASTEFVTSAIDIYTYVKCDNIATLRQNPVEDGKAFIVGGYYQVGDGASGIFYPSPTVPKAQFTGSIAMVGGAAVLTVSSIVSGIIYAGMKLTGDLIATQLYIAQQLTGTNGGVGTYALYDQTGNSPILTIPSSSMTGTMYWDNGGTVILPAGSDGTRAWLREISGPINVKWFGAKGDNSNNDTTAIQAAINSVAANGSNATQIYFPAGKYKISTSLSVTGRAINLRGDGPKASIIAPTANILAILINGTGLTNSDTCGVFDLSVSEASALTTMTAIKVQNISTIYLSNLYITTSGTAIDIGSSATPDVNFSMLNQIRIEAYGGQAAIRLRCGGGDWSNIYCRKYRIQGVTGPTVWITGQVTSLQVANCEFGGKGTARRNAISSITSTASAFTVNATGHGFIAGETILISGTSTGYDGTWQIATSATNSFTVASTANIGTVTPSTAYADKLHACVYFDNTYGPINETSWSNVLLEGIDDGGSAGGAGSVALYIDASIATYTIADHNFNNLFCDVGQTGVHICGKHIGNGEVLTHGYTFNNLDIKFVRNGVYLHDCKGIQFSNVKTTCVRSQGNAHELSKSAAIRLDGLGYQGITGITLTGGHWGRQSDWRTDWISSFTPDYGIVFGGYVQDIHLTGCHFYGQSAAAYVDTWGELDAASRVIDTNCTYASGAGESSSTRIPSVSSASVISIPFGDVVKVTGTTTVNNMTNGWIGRRVAIIATGALTFNTGGNIANTVTTAAGQLVTAVFDGTAWHLR